MRTDFKVDSYTYTCIHTYIHTYIHTCAYVHTYIEIHTYTHTHTNIERMHLVWKLKKLSEQRHARVRPFSTQATTFSDIHEPAV